MAVKSSFKNMTLCLLTICLICSAVLAVVYSITKEPIEIAKKEKDQKAIKEVMPASAVVIDTLRTISIGAETYKYNTAFEADSITVVGYAINVAPVGFGGPIEMKVGITDDGLIWNVKVLSHAETPGLGAKCTEPAFSGQFHKVDPSDPKNLKITKDGGKDGGKINAITASTITSRAYSQGVARAVEVFNAIKQAEAANSAQSEDATDISSEEPSVISSEEPSVIPSEVEESKEMEE